MKKEFLYQEYYLKKPHVCIDTRTVVDGSIFFALGRKDEHGVHRGAAFAEQAKKNGAAAIVHNDPKLDELYKMNSSWFYVEDVEKALQTFAAYHRQHLDIPIIVVAGSNGKTTTRGLIKAVLETKYNVFTTKGNLNNHLGVPLSLLQIQADHQIAILEVGANHLGETRFLVDLIRPTMGLLTNNGKDHLGEYGSFENVVRANKELYDHFVACGNGKILLNATDPSLVKSAEAVQSPICYGRPHQDIVWAELLNVPDLELMIHVEGHSFRVKMALFGAFWANAVLAAVQLGVYYKISSSVMKTALEAFQPAALRSQCLNWQQHHLLLDCYNANPSSMKAFLEAVQASSKSPKVLVLGEMLELGKYSRAEHQKLLTSWIDYTAYDLILLIGSAFKNQELPKEPNLYHFTTIEEAEDLLITTIKNERYHIYVKGSRGNQLEKIFS